MDFKDDCPSTGPEAIGGNIALAFWWISHVLLTIYCLELPTLGDDRFCEKPWKKIGRWGTAGAIHQPHCWMVAGTASQGF
jgi:hypothetical protein